MRLLLALELAAVLDEVTRWQFGHDLLADFLLRLGNQTVEIAPGNIARNDNAPLHVFAVNEIWLLLKFNLRDLAQGDFRFAARAFRLQGGRVHEDIADGLEVAARLVL